MLKLIDAPRAVAQRALQGAPAMRRAAPTTHFARACTVREDLGTSSRARSLQGDERACCKATSGPAARRRAGLQGRRMHDVERGRRAEKARYRHARRDVAEVVWAIPSTCQSLLDRPGTTTTPTTLNVPARARGAPLACCSQRRCSQSREDPTRHLVLTHRTYIAPFRDSATSALLCSQPRALALAKANARLGSAGGRAAGIASSTRTSRSRYAGARSPK
jgi:hypothetical protein